VSLVVDETAHAFEQKVLRRRREFALDAFDQGTHCRVTRLRRWRGERCGFLRFAIVAALSPRERGAEGLEAGLDAHAATLDGGLELRAAEGQHARAGQCTEQHSTDHAAPTPRRPAPMSKRMKALGGLGGMREQLRAVDAAHRPARFFPRWRTRGASRRSAWCGHL
jgi:hypothetical protein